MRRTGTLFIALSFVASFQLLAQSHLSGTIAGRVMSTAGPLKATTIEARSAALPRVRTQSTDGDGSFRFPLLPPGEYEIVASHDGFAPTVLRGVTVSAGQTASVTFDLRLTAAETISVAGEPPLLDVTSPMTSISMSADSAASLPVRRNYTDVAQLAPGTRTDAFGITFYGSTSLESQYVIDGVNVTGADYGNSTKSLSVSFVDEAQVLTGGLPAEYGRTMGGIVNATIKSGSNVVRGSGFAYGTGGSLLAEPAYVSELPATQFEITDTERESDYGFETGGPIRRDRLWFFAGVDRSERRQNRILLMPLNVTGFSLPAGGKIPRDLRRNLVTAKLTFAPGSHQIFSVSLNGDGGRTEGAVRGIGGPPSTWEGFVRSGGLDVAVRHAAVYGARWAVDAMTGRNVQTSDVGGPGESVPRVNDFSQSPSVSSGGLGQFFDWQAKRFVSRIDVTSIVAAHTLKAGIDAERVRMHDEAYYSGGDRIQVFCRSPLVNRRCPSDADLYYVHTSWVDESKGFKLSDPATYFASLVHPWTNRATGQSTSFYVQDTWSVGDVTLNAGIRVDRQSVHNRQGRLFTLTNPALRLGLVWAGGSRKRQKVYAFAGRYYPDNALGLIYSTVQYPQIQVANLDPTPRNFTPDPRAPAFRSSGTQYQITGIGSPNFAGDDLRGSHLDEYLIGYDVEAGARWILGAKATYRTVGEVLESMATKEGVVFVNPGRGRGAKILTIAGEEVATPDPVRRFGGVELHARRRFGDGTQLFASYLWSRLYGNYEGLFQETTGYPVPNDTWAFEWADFLVNAYGPLQSDRTHQLKLAASYRISAGRFRGLEPGLVTRWYSGAPLTAMGVSYSSFTYSYFLTPRGALGRGPSEYEIDVHLGYPVGLGPVRATVIVDVFNALNRQSATTPDLGYNTRADGRCGGVPQSLCNGDGGLKSVPGTTQPAGSISPDDTAPNPHFLRGSGFTGQRSVRLGARLTF